MLEHSGESLLWTRWFVHSNIGRRPVCIWLMRSRFQPQLRSLLTGNRLDPLCGGAWPLLVGGVICLVDSVNERDLDP